MICLVKKNFIISSCPPLIFPGPKENKYSVVHNPKTGVGELKHFKPHKRLEKIAKHKHSFVLLKKGFFDGEIPVKVFGCELVLTLSVMLYIIIQSLILFFVGYFIGWFSERKKTKELEKELQQKKVKK